MIRQTVMLLTWHVKIIIKELCTFDTSFLWNKRVVLTFSLQKFWLRNDFKTYVAYITLKDFSRNSTKGHKYLKLNRQEYPIHV